MRIKIDPDLCPSATAIEIPVVVTKCGCGAKTLILNHQLPDNTWVHLCPTPKSVQHILLGAWYKNKLKNFIVQVKIRIQERRRSLWRPLN